jgi:hypothetical protein
MDIFHWAGAGIDVFDNTAEAERGRLLNTNPTAVRIENSFIHSNRQYGLGYGAAVSGGAYAFIAHNVFDVNRHAIAGDSVNKNNKDFSGYTARENLILSGGGLHCKVVGHQPVFCWRTHQIDMHGTEDGKLGVDEPAEHCCGIAGETILIERNTILYAPDTVLPIDGHAIKIRGNPTDKAVVDGNVFKHKSRSDAIAQNGNSGFGDNITNPIDVRGNNIFGSDPSTELGRCDFVGDGQQDEFMATGVTWWARSPVTGQWRYLNTRPERFPDIELGDVNHDGKCDVFQRRPSMWSNNGTGPWQPFPIVDPS